MAEIFNEHFTSIGHNLAKEIPQAVVNPDYYLKPTVKKFSLQVPSVDIVCRLLNNTNENKATGLDGIPCKLLKAAADVVAPSLTKIFEQSILTGIFPTEWKLARVTPVFKKGPKSDPNNYRPISVIPVVSKILEKIIYDQLYDYLNNNMLLTNCQSGFRSLHSTMTALLRATNNWSINIDKGHINGVIFIDLKKAFDTVNHEIIIRKLQNYGLDRNALAWFQSYLSNRSQKCLVNGKLSDSRPITCGVPQGSIIGPLLFLVYINDLPNCLDLAVPNMFADDTNVSLSADNLNDLQITINSELHNLNSWLKANKLSLNIAKTEFMVIGSWQKLSQLATDQIEIQIEGIRIERVYDTKSLGLYIDDKLSWSCHIDEISRKIASGISALRRVRPFISTKIAVMIYKALILPHMDYCCQVWDGLSNHLSDKLQKLQNRAARVVTKSNYETRTATLLDSLQWDALHTRRNKLKAILMYKSLNKLAPEYLKELFLPKRSKYDLRDNEGKLVLPLPRTNYLKRAFSYSGADLWNKLPHEVRNAGSLTEFKRKLNHVSL